ncbi:hypothetical protein NKH47_14710 [Mesorhizobium sp. M1060]|uniref:hypothetical protein n=1 Tax=unclassified Mesorhizobium TaxID=325217 RepID=UPI0003CE37E0|nr:MULTISPECIES: hypothetical protein [unclassified Mesorhizobium]ESW88661.1 hypothetical protein X770_15435 [Mesorhizobium sp. LSJC269B00]ESX50431.1 hypothetical protein X762_08940 [Mesorhizobium sp. LSHC426A00]ESX57867.1 hypothetical protein X761_07850 [Mesorhizobium sp. LSHC424B00]ESX75396.1 hypothetical protein X758_04110 [Mesorhizobium sp. LSHC416B00]ESZ07230.1 hypothetical protein X736_12840 [Mesorhizobium sp. L2C089B000]
MKNNNPLTPILKGKAAIESYVIEHWICHPNGDRLEKRASFEEAKARAKELLAKGVF